MSAAPISIALVNDYEVVLVGVAHMFDAYPNRVSVEQLDAGVAVTDEVDIALYDTFGQPEADQDEIVTLIDNPLATRVVVYTWNFGQHLIDDALAKGASGYLSKRLNSLQLVEALESVHAGEIVVSAPPPRNRLSIGLDWPGRTAGLSERESEILALITQGRSNVEIAGLVCLSINSIKTYNRSAYRKIRVTNRVGAVLWGVEHGFRPDHRRLDDWNPHPIHGLGPSRTESA